MAYKKILSCNNKHQS